MGRAGGEQWYQDPNWRFEPVSLSSGRTIHPEDMDWNVPLSNGGANDARSAGKRLADRVKRGAGAVDHIFCSPAWRCQQTAHYMAVELGIKFKSVVGLHECYREGNGFADAAAKRFGKGAEPPWLTNKELGEMKMAVDTRFVDESEPTRVYESVPSYFSRMKSTLMWLCRKYPRGNIVIAGHLASGAIVRLILERPEVKQLDQDLMNSIPGLRVIPGSITTLKADGERWEFHDLDDAQFLWADRGSAAGASSFLEMAQMNGHGNPVLCCVASRSTSIVVSGSADNSLRVWDIKHKRCAGTLLGHSRPVLCCDISPDGQLIVSGSHDAELRFWDPQADAIDKGEQADAKCVLEIPSAHMKPVRCAKFSPDGNWVASGSYDKTVRLWTKRGFNAVVMEGHKGTVRSVAWHPYSAVVASAGEDKKILIWDVSGISEARSKMCEAPVPVVVDNAHNAAVATIQFAPSGDYLASGSYDGHIIIWRHAHQAKPERVRSIEAHPGRYVNCLVWSRDSKRIVSCSDDETIKVWTDEGELLVSMIGHRKAVCMVDFAGEDMLLSSSEDNTCRLWDVSQVALEKSKQHSLTMVAAAEGEQVSSSPETDKPRTKGGTVVDSAVTNARAGAKIDVRVRVRGESMDKVDNQVASEVSMKSFAEQERRAALEKERMENDKKGVLALRNQANLKQEQHQGLHTESCNQLCDKLKFLLDSLNSMEHDLASFQKQCDVKKLAYTEPPPARLSREGARKLKPPPSVSPLLSKFYPTSSN
eukprot:TRINITY_DN18974_c0_g1_i2.p1 TRINITY_DN18974_c0_g1~~TRINITY_DN18974_c0_g1_i2.p1  ORF type:complete len:761 (+),score=164.03 TRINITY_DN18974_c0_g1_i2:224-2506(+)